VSRYLGANRTHGIRATYNAGCHCPDCREAERLYRRRLRGSVREIGRRRVGVLPPLDRYPDDPFQGHAA
jgi:hypothetical protein